MCATGLFLLPACGEEDPAAEQNETADRIQTAWRDHVATTAELHELTSQLERECAQARGITRFDTNAAGILASSELTRSALMGVAQPRVDAKTAESIGYQEIHSELWLDFPAPTTDETVDGSRAVPEYAQVAGMFGEEFADAYFAALNAGERLELSEDTPGMESVSVPGAISYVEYFTDGCKGDVANELYEGDPAAHFEAALAVAPNLNPYLLTDAQYLAIEQDWAECMRDKGYNVSYFGRETHLLAEYYADDPTTFDERQKELASEDAHCVQRRDVNERNRELFESVVVDYFESNELEAKLADMQAANEDALLRGSRITGDLSVWQ